MSPQTPAADTSHFSSSLARGLSVIKTFDRSAPMLRIADVAARTGLDRATARRFLLTLADLGYVGRSDDLFYLRPSALDIGFSYLASLDAAHAIQPVLNELTNLTKETSSFGILDGADIRLLARSANSRMINITIPLGLRTPALTTSIGRAILGNYAPDRLASYLKAHPASSSSLKEASSKEFGKDAELIHQQGWAAIERSLGAGFSSIAVPVRDRERNVVAGINVVEYPPRNKPAAMARKYLRMLKDASRQIEAVLQAAQHPIGTMLHDLP